MRFILFLICSVFVARAQAQSSDLGYDLTNLYANPLASVPSTCLENVQAEFYRVYRPIMPLVNHVIIGVDLKGTCEGQSLNKHLIFGASKGPGDLVSFENELAQPTDNLEPLGLASGANANLALQAASNVSRAWETKLQNKAYLYTRIVVTPVFGRPCALAAEDVKEAIAPWLTK